MRDERGQMSIDLLAGFAIFMLALIVVAAMVPGLLAGLQCSTIDYDAVAYRTAVILVEDPGMPYSPAWDLKDASHKEDIERLGLAVSREYPNILAITKVMKFFDDAYFTYPDDYSTRLALGDIPYAFNISLLTGDGRYYGVGEERPSIYGYIRRVVKVKGFSGMELCCKDRPEFNATVTEDVAQEFTVRLDGSVLLDDSVPLPYRIDPRIEPVTVNITGLGAYLNTSPNPSPLADHDISYTYATLDTVRFHKNYAAGSLPFPYTTIDSSKYTFSIDGAPDDLSPDAQVCDNLSLILEPGVLPIDQSCVIDIIYTFNDDPPQTLIHGTIPYDYTNVTSPDLMHGTVEVAVW